MSETNDKLVDVDDKDPLFPVRQAICKIQEKEGTKPPKKTIVGQIECPQCGHVLSYRVSSINGRIWGQCESEDCLNWVQ